MKLILAALALLIAGCASPTSSYITGTVRDPIDASEVKVYLTPPDSYEEIALVESTSRGAFGVDKTEYVINGLKAEAAKVGANGIVIQGVGDTEAYSYTLTNSDGTPSGQVPINRKTAQAIAIHTQ